MLLNSKVILRTDTEPAMISLRKKVQGIRKMKNLDAEVQDEAPDEHQGLQVERWVQTVRNLSKTLVYGVESKAESEDHIGKYAIPVGSKTCSILVEQVCCKERIDTFRSAIRQRVQRNFVTMGKRCVGKTCAKVKEKVNLG